MYLKYNPYGERSIKSHYQVKKFNMLNNPVRNLDNAEAAIEVFVEK